MHEVGGSNSCRPPISFLIGCCAGLVDNIAEPKIRFYCLAIKHKDLTRYNILYIGRGDREKTKCLETEIKHLFLEQSSMNKSNTAFIFQKKGFVQSIFL